jgi:hypothetical protein
VKPHGKVERPVEREIRIVNHSSFSGVFNLEIENDAGKDDLDFLEGENKPDTATPTCRKFMVSK